MQVEINHLETERTPVWGGFKLLSKYEVLTTSETFGNHFKNRYTVVCRIAGLETGSIWLEPEEYEAHTNNEETLIESAVFDLFENNIRYKVMNDDWSRDINCSRPTL